MASFKERARLRTKTIGELNEYRNKSIVVTYRYLHETERLRLDDVLAKLVDTFFLTENVIYYRILKETELTEEDLKNIKPIIRKK